VPALIAAKVGRVVAACADPNPAVSGRGFAQLRDAGIAVTTDVCRPEAMQLNAPFFAAVLHHRPYVTLKWAESADGLLAGSGGRTVRISNAAATAQIHAMRSRCDAILVGINTVLHDDPLLIARGIADARPLCRMILDTHLRLPIHSRLVQSAHEHLVWAFCNAASERSAKAADLRKAGVRVVPCGRGEDGRLKLSEVLAACREVTHLLVEPGPTTAASFLAAALVDRIWVIRSPQSIGEPDAPRAPKVPWPATATACLKGDELTEYLNPKGEVFFAAEPSADFRLIGISPAPGTPGEGRGGGSPG
jgi:diaminohydroxyphosphoribosylaminopyrimidine deaminase/5-amino-6-(5-phosphoribosylamino)uracil reductase